MGFNSYIAKQFGNPSGLSGKIVTAIMNNQNRPMYEGTERLLSLSDSDEVLDIGCANGYFLRSLAERYSCVLTGIDISESIIKSATNRNRKFVKNRSVRFSCQNADAMSFANASFDKAYTVNNVYFWDDLDKTMTEIRRVVKPGGLFINTLYTNETLNRFPHTQTGYKKFTPEQITAAIKRAGFETKIVRINDGAAYCVVCT